MTCSGAQIKFKYVATKFFLNHLCGVEEIFSQHQIDNKQEWTLILIAQDLCDLLFSIFRDIQKTQMKIVCTGIVHVFRLYNQRQKLSTDFAHYMLALEYILSPIFLATISPLEHI